MKQTKTIEVVKDSVYSLSMSLQELISYLNIHLEGIPELCRDSATVDFECNLYYDSPYCDFSIEYTRTETNEEHDLRIKLENDYKQAQVELKLAQFNKLKQELGM